MQIRVIAVGKLREPYIAQACADFSKRLVPYHALELIEVRAGKGGESQRTMADEAERVIERLRPGDPLWLLDRSGEQLSSNELSERLEGLASSGERRLTLAIAGTYGAGEALLRRADFVWSLSRLTLLHEWARMLVLEQLYRAAKIARNEPYHH